MHRAAPNADGPNHEVPAAATSAHVAAAPGSRSFCHHLHAAAVSPHAAAAVVRAGAGRASSAFGSAALALAGAYFVVGQHPANAQAVRRRSQTKPPSGRRAAASGAGEREAGAAAPDTLAVLPFEILFEPTPAFQHEVEKLNARPAAIARRRGQITRQAASRRRRRSAIAAIRSPPPATESPCRSRRQVHDGTGTELFDVPSRIDRRSAAAFCCGAWRSRRRTVS